MAQLQPALLQRERHEGGHVRVSPVAPKVLSRSATMSATVRMPSQRLMIAPGAAVELDHALRETGAHAPPAPAPTAAASHARCAGTRAPARSLTPSHPVCSARASFICHSTSSLNCRISSARSCSRGCESAQASRQPELDVAPRQAHAALEVLQSRRDRSTGSAPASWRGAAGGSAGANSSVSEAHTASVPGRAAREVDVGIDGEAHARVHLASGSRPARGEPTASASRSHESMPPGHRHSRHGRGCAAPSCAAPRGHRSWRGWPHPSAGC